MTTGMFGKRSRYRLWSFGYKMFVLYVVSMTVSVSLIGYFSYRKSTEIIEMKVGQIALETIQQADKRIDSILAEYQNRSQLLLGYKPLHKGIMDAFKDNYDRIQTNADIDNFISTTINAENDIARLYVFGEKANSYRYAESENSAFAVWPAVGPEIAGQDWYRDIAAAGGRVVWLGIRPSVLHGNALSSIAEPAGEKRERSRPEASPVFAFGRAIKDVYGTNETIGVALFEMKPDRIRDILGQVDFHSSGVTFMVDGAGRIVGTPDDDRLAGIGTFELSLPAASPGGMMRTSYKGHDTVLVHDPMYIEGWKLVGMAPADHFIRDSLEIRGFTVVLAASLVFVAVALALVASSRMSKPVRRLMQAMKRAREGDFQVQIGERRRDEFGVLYDSFNLMVSRIKSLIDELYIQRLLQTELQLKMMASQINAHFLYNTLDSIHWISRIYKVDEISTMIFGLSNYLRISLSEGKPEVTVREAVQLIDSYLSIQQVRYQDRFTVRMSVDETLSDYSVLKNIFQPIVENAIYHGLETKKGKGELAIRWMREDDRLVYEVADNGVGIEPAKLAEIRESLGSPELIGGDEGCFALKNIHSQLKLAYGEGHGPHIESERGTGTVVRLTVPLRK
ncbi:cache domain-containing sensor histidine kinase [Paenibacillus flagellatus]|uniref:cache domain-containing sensor histidine kinase n=1 Tax=Paenibacillus flagellatus TaxID=2211139 RepID=UPI0013050799|nr:sensor histidine kinase [Paenibacillus flagellatus]